MKKQIHLNALVLAALSLFVLTGACKSSPKDSPSEEAAEKAMEKATGKDVEIENKGADVTIEGDGERVVMSQSEAMWPSDIPDDVPEFKGAKIIRVTRSEMDNAITWNVIYEGTTIDKLDAYDAALKSAGYKTMKMQTPQGGQTSGEKGNRLVSCIVSAKTCMVSVQERKK